MTIVDVINNGVYAEPEKEAWKLLWALCYDLSGSWGQEARAQLRENEERLEAGV